MLNRDEIIDFLKEFSIEKPYVNAMWLEGADGINRVDEYKGGYRTEQYSFGEYVPLSAACFI